MFFQVDIIAAVQSFQYITVVDCARFFHQWFVKRSDRHKLTVANHKSNERWNVVIMGFKNSPAYVQRQIDGLLKFFRMFAKIYVDDVVIFNQTLKKKHAQHLNHVFNFFDKMNIILKPSKSYIEYPSIVLLGQKIDNFGFSTSADKLEIFRTINFPVKLKNLEIYIGMTNYLRNTYRITRN